MTPTEYEVRIEELENEIKSLKEAIDKRTMYFNEEKNKWKNIKKKMFKMFEDI